MPTRPFDDVVQRLATNVPGCPFPVIEKYVRDAAIEACERTLAWRYTQPPIRLTPGLHDYPYEPPTEAEVHAIIHSTLNRVKLTVLTEEELYDLCEDYPNHDLDARGRPVYIVHLDPDTFGVAVVPDDVEDYDVEMRVALKPLRTARGMEETVLDELENAIMDGALAQLYALPDKSWTDKGMADKHARQFVKRCSARRARANLGAGRASVSVKMRPFGGARRGYGRRY